MYVFHVSSSFFKRTRIFPILTNNMEGIRAISTSTIQASNHVNNDIIHLAAWDLGYLLRKMNQKGLLFDNPIDSKDSSMQIQHLKHSLSTTLAFFPPLAGRLVILEHEDNTASSYITCNNEGALFVHAVAENTHVADILQPKYVPHIVNSFFPLNGVYNYEGTSQPLLAVQVTELVDGIFIGCTINHVVADGKSFWHFINSWAEISRGCLKLSKPPALERWFPDGIEPPIRFPFTKEEKKQPENSNPQPPPPPPSRMFHFTKENIERLKSKANEEGSTDKISSLQALLTHIWRSVIRCKRVDQQEAVFFVLLIGIRPRIVPPLPEYYFGNALMAGVVTNRAGELLEGGVEKGAWEMNKFIASHTDEKVRSHYESWVRTPRLPRPTAGVGGNVLVTSSSPRFDVYGNDFGWGKPIAVRNGGFRNEGTITLYGGAEERSIDIEVCLPYEILEAMGNDPDFIDVSSV